MAQVLLLALVAGASGRPALAQGDAVRLITLDPGHFHAALVQKYALPGVSSRVHIYAPLGFDLTEHLKRVVGFNTRPENPTAWQVEVHASGDYLQRFRHDKPGNVVIISGRNATKIDLIDAAVGAGLNVLADKPWIIEASNFDRLAKVLHQADRNGAVAYDIMTERFEATNALQRVLVNTPTVFGALEAGTAEQPGVYMENVHHFMKVVAGKPNIRPGWFFDGRQQGEGMADTGTHLVDLVHWTLAPDQALDVKQDIEMISAQRWPTPLTLSQWQTVTGNAEGFAQLPAAKRRPSDTAEIFANTQTLYKLRGIFIKLVSMWNWQAKPGAGDWHYAVYRGGRASVEVRQGAKQRYIPEVYVVPRRAADQSAVGQALAAQLPSLAKQFPGIQLEAQAGEFHFVLPASLRSGHEAHFSEVTGHFLRYLKDRKSLPAWESRNMLAKYWVTTQATELSRGVPPLERVVLQAPR